MKSLALLAFCFSIAASALAVPPDDLLLGQPEFSSALPKLDKPQKSVSSPTEKSAGKSVDRNASCPAVVEKVSAQERASWTIAKEGTEVKLWRAADPQAAVLICYYLNVGDEPGGNLVFAQPADGDAGLPKDLRILQGGMVMAHRWASPIRWWKFQEGAKGLYANQPCVGDGDVENVCLKDTLTRLQPLLWWGFGGQDLESMDLKQFAGFTNASLPKGKLLSGEK